MQEKDPSGATCPRCARGLPPGDAKVCVYCGAPLSAAAGGAPNLGSRFTSRPARDPRMACWVAPFPAPPPFMWLIFYY